MDNEKQNEKIEIEEEVAIENTNKMESKIKDLNYDKKFSNDHKGDSRFKRN